MALIYVVDDSLYPFRKEGGEMGNGNWPCYIMSGLSSIKKAEKDNYIHTYICIYTYKSKRMFLNANLNAICLIQDLWISIKALLSNTSLKSWFLKTEQQSTVLMSLEKYNF